MSSVSSDHPDSNKSSEVLSEILALPQSKRSTQEDKSYYQSKNSLHYTGWSFTRVKVAGGWEKESRRRKDSKEGRENSKTKEKRWNETTIKEGKESKEN